jgi:hypothetical protein
MTPNISPDFSEALRTLGSGQLDSKMGIKILEATP